MMGPRRDANEAARPSSPTSSDPTPPAPTPSAMAEPIPSGTETASNRLSHAFVRMSMRFIPPASLLSMPTYFPASNEATNEDTKLIRSTPPSPPSPPPPPLRDRATAAISLPVNRSNAREPLIFASCSAPPTACSRRAHSARVLLSIQIGDSPTANARVSCAARVRAGSSWWDRTGSAPFAQYTLPCCCPLADTPEM